MMMQSYNLFLYQNTILIYYYPDTNNKINCFSPNIQSDITHPARPESPARWVVHAMDTQVVG